MLAYRSLAGPSELTGAGEADTVVIKSSTSTAARLYCMADAKPHIDADMVQTSPQAASDYECCRSTSNSSSGSSNGSSSSSSSTHRGSGSGSSAKCLLASAPILPQFDIIDFVQYVWSTWVPQVSWPA
jgi:hypothetical protein